MYDQKPWLKFYDPHVPPSLDYPQIVLDEQLTRSAGEFPDHPYLIYKGRKINYREFDALVNRFAAALQQLGVQKGDRVAIHLPNCPEFPIAYFATLRAGGIVVPCNPVYTTRELAHQLNDSGARVILTIPYQRVRDIRESTALEHVIVARIQHYFPPLLRLLFTLLREKKMGLRFDITGEANTYWFSDILDRSPVQPAPVARTPDDTAVLMYTGGTTGLSKGAQLTHRNIMANAYQGKVWINTRDNSEVVIATLPLFHSYGMTTCMNATILSGGTMVLIPNPHDIKDIVRSIVRYRPTYYPGVPAFYIAVNNFPGIEKFDLSSIKVCSSGAAPLPLEVQQRFQALTGARLAEGYGLSEASPVTHGNPAFGDNRIGTIGLPWPDTEVKVVDAETGEHYVSVGEAGELCIRGPQVMTGYWNMPTETANTLRPDPGGGLPWLFTGDIAAMNEDGYFQIVDRKKDLILGAGGFNIYPREIEDILYEHPKVLEAAVAGIQYEDKGERVVAFITPKPGLNVTEEEILAFCRENLSPYKVPRSVVFREFLPKTLVGKVLRRELVREMLESREA